MKWSNSHVHADEKRIETISQWVEGQHQAYADIDFSFPEANPDFGCPLLSDTDSINCGFRIAPNGDVFPCQMFFDSEFCLGNLYKKQINDIVEGQDLQKFLTLIRFRRSYIHKCQSCVCQSICIGGCPAKAYLDSGNIFPINGPCEKRKEAYHEVIEKALAKAVAV